MSYCGDVTCYSKLPCSIHEGKESLTKQKLNEGRLSALLGKFNGTLQWIELGDGGGRQSHHPIYIKTTLENDELVINRRVTNPDGTTLTVVYWLRATHDAGVLKGTCSYVPGGTAVLQEVSGSNLLVLTVVGDDGATRLLTTITINPTKGTQSQTVNQWNTNGSLIFVGVASELVPTDRIQDPGKMIQPAA